MWAATSGAMLTCDQCGSSSPAWAQFCGSCGRSFPRPPSEDALVGQVIEGRYEVLRPIASGSMSTIYLAEQRMGTTSRHVAIKVLPRALRDADLVARFHREAALVVSLHHPNTIRFYDFGELPDGTLYIAMEYVEGEPLRQVIARGRLPLERVRGILSQVVGSLGEAHSRGIVHRDLKPDNVLVVPHGHTHDFVKVLDFGIAKPLRGALLGAPDLTEPGTLLGTPAYMSPEQLAGAEIDTRTDIYALGVMAYEMLIGEPPFAARTPMEWAAQHLHASPRRFDEVVPDLQLPPFIEDAVLHALAKRREDRPSTVDRFFEEISGASSRAAPLEVGSARPPSPAARPVTPRRRPRRTVGLGILVGLGLLLAATAVGLVTWAVGDPPAPPAGEQVEVEPAPRAERATEAAVAQSGPPFWMTSIHEVTEAADAQHVLGARDGRHAEVRSRGAITVELGHARELAADGTDLADLIVHVGPRGRGPYRVAVSPDGRHFRIVASNLRGTGRVDLDDAGLSSARYVRVQNRRGEEPLQLDAIAVRQTAPLASSRRDQAKP